MKLSLSNLIRESIVSAEQNIVSTKMELTFIPKKEKITTLNDDISIIISHK